MMKLLKADLHVDPEMLSISPNIQNELLHIMSGMVQGIICRKIQEAGYFTILVDESKDC